MTNISASENPRDVAAGRCRRRTANGAVAGEVLAGTKVRDIVALLADSDLPVAVVDAGGARIGVVTRSDASSVIAGEEL